MKTPSGTTTVPSTPQPAPEGAGVPLDVDNQALTRQRNREKTLDQLQYAMLRVKNLGKKLSISAVAAEAGVTPGLIHNTYPDIAEAIRAQIGKATRQQRDNKIAELAEAKGRMKELRAELEAAMADIQRLASTNETLRQEVTILRSAASGNIAILPTRTS
jgi:AcrR family transcriptional regulator